MRVNLRRLVGSWIVVLASTASLAAASDLRLIEALKNNNTVAVPALLKEHIDVNTPQADGATALDHRDVHGWCSRLSSFSGEKAPAGVGCELRGD